MKKNLFLIIFAFFAFLALILVTGCGSKNNDRVKIMENLIGTWEYEINKNTITVKATYSFDNSYKFAYKATAIFKGDKEVTLKDLTGTYGLNMDTKKIILTFDDKEESEGLIKELTYKYENGNFAFSPNADGDATYSKK